MIALACQDGMIIGKEVAGRDIVINQNLFVGHIIG